MLIENPGVFRDPKASFDPGDRGIADHQAILGMRLAG